MPSITINCGAGSSHVATRLLGFFRVATLPTCRNPQPRPGHRENKAVQSQRERATNPPLDPSQPGHDPRNSHRRERSRRQCHERPQDPVYQRFGELHGFAVIGTGLWGNFGDPRELTSWDNHLKALQRPAATPSWSMRRGRPSASRTAARCRTDSIASA